jgi:hypothetical protein
MNSILYLILSALAGAGVAFGAYFLTRTIRHRRLLDSLKSSLYLIKIPKELPNPNQKEPRDFKTEINKSEQLFSNLSSFKKPFVLEVAVPHVGEEIRFYMAVPRNFSEIAIKQVQGLWHNASVTPVTDDYNIFNPNGITVGAYCAQKQSFVLPMRTYTEIQADTFASILGAFSKVSEVGEGAALQIVAFPAPEGAKKKIHGFIAQLKRGEPAKKVFADSPFHFEQFKGALNIEQVEREKAQRVVDEDAVKALEAKIAKPLFRVNVRLLASAASAFQANDILEGLAAGFSQFASPIRNEFKLVKVRNAAKLAYQFSFRSFDSSQEMILNAEEIASLYHLPISTTETPRVTWLKSKEAPSPDNLPKDGTFIGYATFRDENKPVHITDADRERHIYVIGQTGTGKSTILGALMLADLQKGKGFAVIDPHGDLAEGILRHMPKERVDDVIYFNPGDLWRPLGLNMLEYHLDRPEEKTFIVNEMMSIFMKLFPPETLGPMFEQYMRNALLLIMEDMANEPGTLMEVPRVFTDAEYRRRKLARIRNPVVIDFWEKEAIKAGGEASLANMTPYITSKFNNFTANDYMRPIIGQAKSAFNFRDVMDEGKILVINLAKGKIGDINANLLGMIFTGKILMAALSRVDVPQERRKTFNLYIDEFQNFTTDSISVILSEARKYKLTLNIAHQFIAQLTEKVRDSVFGNVGNIIAYRVGAQDAEFLVKQFDPVFNQNDLINIDNLNAYVKLLVNGETTKPFSIKVSTAFFDPGSADIAEKMKEYSRLKYGADRQAVEDDIYRRLRE